MARVKKVYGPTVTIVRESRHRPEPTRIDPEVARKLEILKAVIENGEKHGLDKLDELAKEQAEKEKQKLEGRPKRGGPEN